ncbi:nuclear transport factor 2 family protein [Lacihabitans sp. LS3-19]|uniref:YybH family protein n=1 Tax=Lacihabitans sp. LS3-19 TaxID=2487335 RepID=UPI0020CECB2A|nr:nuclear transport factor 2 family protein [Lacihabitans sp. LS3-19]MCP9770366.1 nuclear transport factor 2 family protein [Lacihabitans sp. LS3-19]
MKKILIPIVAIFLMTSCGEKSNQESNKSLTKKTEIMKKEEKQKIEELLSAYKKSLNTSDAKLAQSLYTKDGVFMPTEAPSGIGAEGILKSYEFVFSQIQLNIEFFIEEIEVEGNMAFAVTSSKGTVKIRENGVEAPEANRELFVFEKVDGEWKIARYMFNKTEPKG